MWQAKRVNKVSEGWLEREVAHQRWVNDDYKKVAPSNFRRRAVIKRWQQT